MNIIILNDFAHVEGGASKVALSSAKALASRGHRVSLFTAVGPVDESLMLVPNLQVHCLNQHEILKDPNRSRAVLQGLWNRRSGRRFGQMLQAFSPKDTVVHLHTWTKGLSASPLHTAVEHGFKTVMTLHDYFSACPTGGFFIFPAKKLCPLRAMSLACVQTQCDSRSYGHKLWRVGRTFAQRNIGGIPSRIDRFITISEKSESILRPYLPLGASLHRVDNPIETEKGPPIDPALYDRFCYVGRLAPEKGPDLLAECVSGVQDLKLVFVGDGPEREMLTCAIPSAEFTGWVAPDVVRSVMKTSRALVFPSRWYETQGMVVSEASAIGLPVIVPSESAAREWVEDNVTGLVFQHGNSEDLRRKLTWIRDNPSAARDMGARAYKRYWGAPCTMQTHCSRLEGVYEEMLRSIKTNIV